MPPALGAARVPLQIDIGFGDAVAPASAEGTYPTLLSFPAPRLRFYPRETVVAEKFEAIVSLGMANSRLKDFFDMWLLSEHFPFEGPTLCRALEATFARRGTSVPTDVPPADVPLALTPQFSENPAKMVAWRAFTHRNTMQTPELSVVALQLQRFLMPPVRAIVEQGGLEAQWQPGGEWKKS